MDFLELSKKRFTAKKFDPSKKDSGGRHQEIKRDSQTISFFS